MPEELNENDLPSNSMEQMLAAFDIREFIDRLPEPERTMCFSLIVEGQKVRMIAEAHGVHPKTILRHVRRALAPLARTFGILAADKFICDEKPKSAKRAAKGDRKGGK